MGKLNKCIICKKKLKIVQAIQGKCRCGQIYCHQHIIGHTCEFDYKTLQKQKIIQENPHIIADKVSQI